MEEQQQQCILAHECCHIRRLDPLWKMLAFVLLAVYWWNPLAWLAFFYMVRDMEMSCDEAVIASFGNEIKNVLKFKKPHTWVAEIAAVLIAIAAVIDTGPGTGKYRTGKNTNRCQNRGKKEFYKKDEEIDFVIDRPFMFILTGGDGSILFSGIVRNIEERML